MAANDVIAAYKEYRVEFWCGRYAYGNAYGEEISIYYRPLSDALEKPHREKEVDLQHLNLPARQSTLYK
jgi:hypothetical protein